MIYNYILLALGTFFISASDPYFGYDLTFTPMPKAEASDVREVSWLATDKFDYYLKDEDDRISKTFKIPPYYYPNVKFWFMTYTHFDSSQVVIHDKSNLNLIYKVLDFSSLHKKNLPKNTIYVLQQKISAEKIEKIQNDLDELAINPYSLDIKAKSMYRMIQHAGIKLPIEKAARSEVFRRLRSNLRTQTGQKNFIRDGILRSLPYQKFLTTYFQDKGLPKELLAIPFLESSFNPQAHSKVNALGIWQFMPHIAHHFVPKSSHYDYRSNVGVASVAAGFLMAENYKILKSWDLAITAYNSGTKHLLKSKRLLEGKKVNLESVIKISDSLHFGFASKNFYSEFLALVHTRAYQEEIFKDLHKHDRPDVDETLRFFVSKCPLRFDKVFGKTQLDDTEFHNHHIKELSKTYPRGTILTAKSELPGAKFLELKHHQMVKTKPKTWDLFLGGQSCSTR